MASRKVSGLGLTARYPFTGTTSPNVEITGASASASAGSVSVSVPTARKTHVGPMALVSQAKNFDIAPPADVFVAITGAQINLQAAVPDSANVTIYPDTAAITGEGGDISDDTATISGGAAAAEAGTVTVSVSTYESITGAAANAGAGEVTGIGGVGGVDVNATVSGVEMAAEAGTVTPTYDWYQSVTGAQISSGAANVGVDTGASPSDVAVIVYGAVTSGEAGSVAFAEAESGPSPKGRGKGGKARSKRRYVVNVDGEVFEAKNLAEVQTMLAEVRKLAKEQAETETLVKPVKLSVKTGAGDDTRQSTILSEMRQTRQAVEKAQERQQATIDKKIAHLMNEQDDEDAILALLLVE